MINISTEPGLTFMRDLERRFRATSGLIDRRDYSIFYSRLQPAPIFVIGINPGGPRDGTHQLASQSFYEDWSHEYVDMNYKIASVMRSALMTALEASVADQLRGVPKSNCFFQRAVGTEKLRPDEIRANATQCAPFLGEMLFFVQPEVLILEGAGARKLIMRHHVINVREDPSQRVTGLRWGAINTFFRREKAFAPVLGREVVLLTLGHPSRFGNLPAWPETVAALRANLGASFLPAYGCDPRRCEE